MKIILHKAEDRGHADYGWLKTHYSFSFANWYDPARMGFGTLRVINDDYVAPRSGFPTHEHDNMEIITIVMRGAVTHTDSMGNSGKVRAGEVQVMSAGTGVRHSEMNDESEPLELFQIWILPKKNDIAPRYDQKKIKLLNNKFSLIVSGNKVDDSLLINQDANIFLGKFEKGQIVNVEQKKHKGIYVLLVSGQAEVGDVALAHRDAIGVSEADSFQIEFKEESLALMLEVDQVE